MTEDVTKPDAKPEQPQDAAPEGQAWQHRRFDAVDLGEKLFELRDYTPVPLIVLALFVADPSARSATLGTLLCVFGELVRLYSVAFIGSVSRTRNTTTTGGKLITTGPFGIVRNPLYVGNFFITMGIASFTGVAWLVALAAAAFAFQYYCIVKYEEKLLLGRFGKEYEEFLDSVPAFIPQRVPDLDTLEWPNSFSDALRSERRTLAAIGVLLVTLAILSGNHKA